MYIPLTGLPDECDFLALLDGQVQLPQHSGRLAGGVAEPGGVQVDVAPDVKVARWQNLIPSFPWIAPGWRAWGRNPRKGRDQILQRSVAES